MLKINTSSSNQKVTEQENMNGQLCRCSQSPRPSLSRLSINSNPSSSKDMSRQSGERTRKLNKTSSTPAVWRQSSSSTLEAQTDTKASLLPHPTNTMALPTPANTLVVVVMVVQSVRQRGQEEWVRERQREANLFVVLKRAWAALSHSLPLKHLEQSPRFKRIPCWFCSATSCTHPPNATGNDQWGWEGNSSTGMSTSPQPSG